MSLSERLARLTDAPSRLISPGAKERLSGFFSGWAYPLLIAALTLVGHLFAIEVITFFLGVLTLLVMSFVQDTARPFIPFACMLVFHVSRANSPGVPSFSDYYVTGWRLPVVVGAFVIIFISVVVFALRRRLFSDFSRRDAELLLPLVGLLVAFSLGGAFSDAWSVVNMGFGVLEGLMYFVIFFFFYRGLRGEDFQQLGGYFAYVSSVTAVVLCVEVAALYLGLDTPISGGEIMKGQIVFGWGIWTSMGLALAVLIPAIFVGAYSSRAPFGYFAVATLTLGCIFLTLSRNAWLVGAAAYAASVLVLALFGRHKRVYRIIAAALLLGVLLGAVLLFDRLPGLIAALFNDNGRYELWRLGLENFLSAPIFGRGFFGFQFPDDPNYFTGVGFMPAFVHQTFIELLSATGVVGLLAYIIYRVSTVRICILRPSVKKTLVAMSALVMLLMSLIDNFAFNFWPVLHYSIAIAVVATDAEEPQL